MTKKDYIKIARVLREYQDSRGEPGSLRGLERAFSHMLAEDNPAFDPIMFRLYLNHGRGDEEIPLPKPGDSFFKEVLH